MKKIIVLICLCFAGLFLKAQTTTPNQLVTKLKTELMNTKKEMLKLFPDFGSISGITPMVMEIEVGSMLHSDNMGDVITGTKLWKAHAKCEIYEWYINKINKTSNPNTKKALVNEYIEVSELIKNLSIFRAEMASWENFGGSMSRLDYLTEEREVYIRWTRVLFHNLRSTQRVSSEELPLLIETMDNIFKGTFEETESIQGRNPLLTESYNNGIEALENIKAQVTKKSPYKWIFQPELDEIISDTGN